MKGKGTTISDRISRMNSWIFGGQFGSLADSFLTRARSARSWYPQCTISLRADLRVQEGRQLGVLLAVLVGLAEALLDLGQATRLQTVGANLVEHARLPSMVRVAGSASQEAPTAEVA
jgi:hypothetical protein